MKDEDRETGTLIPNSSPVGEDSAATPIAVYVPIVLMEDHYEVMQWFRSAIDDSSAAQLDAMVRASNVFALPISVPLILPAADTIRSAHSDLGEITADPIRVQLRCRSAIG